MVDLVHVVLGDKCALRAHHIQLSSGGQVLIGPGGEHSPDVLFDGDPDFTRFRFSADRVAAADFLPVQSGAQCDILSGNVVVLADEPFRHSESDLDGVGCQTADLGNGEGVELRPTAVAGRAAVVTSATLG